MKKKFPKSKHIAGGTHIDMLPDECAEKFDTIIIGPAEKNFKISLESNNKILKEDYTNIPFSETPYPRRDFLPFKSVFSKEMFKQYGEYNATMVYFSRGCFYRCTFCQNATTRREVNAEGKSGFSFFSLVIFWYRRWDSNPLPPVPQTVAPPVELLLPFFFVYYLLLKLNL